MLKLYMTILFLKVGYFISFKNCLFDSHNVVTNFQMHVLARGRPKKDPLSYPSALCLHLTNPFHMSAFSIIHCSMVWQCNSWCSQNALLIITTIKYCAILAQNVYS